MIRKRENPVAWRAGLFSVLVHGLLLGILVVSVNWKSVRPMNVAEVELWDALPAPTVKPAPAPKSEPIKPEPAPEKPEPVKVEPAPKPEMTEKADIALKAKKPEIVKPEPPAKPEPPKEDPDLKKKELQKKQQEALKKLQQSLLEEDSKAMQQEAKQQVADADAAKASQANAGEVDKYIAQITNKIRHNVNRQLCGNGKPELEVAISLIPTGEVIGNPKLLKTSGIASCDEAVERAILQSQPLPLPSKPELFNQFRELKLKFRPNDGN
jgi:colicin import membrane protein